MAGADGDVMGEQRIWFVVEPDLRIRADPALSMKRAISQFMNVRWWIYENWSDARKNGCKLYKIDVPALIKMGDGHV